MLTFYSLPACFHVMIIWWCRLFVFQAQFRYIENVWCLSDPRRGASALSKMMTKYAGFFALYYGLLRPPALQFLATCLGFPQLQRARYERFRFCSPVFWWFFDIRTQFRELTAEFCRKELLYQTHNLYLYLFWPSGVRWLTYNFLAQPLYSTGKTALCQNLRIIATACCNHWVALNTGCSQLKYKAPLRRTSLIIPCRSTSSNSHPPRPKGFYRLNFMACSWFGVSLGELCTL